TVTETAPLTGLHAAPERPAESRPLPVRVPRPRAGGALYRRRPPAHGPAHVQRTLEPHMSPNPAPAGTADGTRSGASAAPKRPRPKKTRSEGQWAKGYREPLNPVERFKRDDAPLNVRDRITDLYAELGHGSI